MHRDPPRRTDPSPQQLFRTLPGSRNDAASLDDIIVAMGLDSSQLPPLRGYLTEFVRAGLASSKNGRYWKKRTDLLIGTLRGTLSGDAFVIPAEEFGRDRGDLFINRRWMGPALHGDVVIARVSGTTARGREGRVETVLVRTNRTVVGRLIRAAREWIVSPNDERFLYDIVVRPADISGAAEGDVVVVEITRPPDAGRNPAGRVVEVLGREDSPGIDLKIVIRKHRLPEEFSHLALEEADTIPETAADDQFEGRLDLRNDLTVTIDGETARDFDDAVSLKSLPNGRFLLGVHIADVSHYVRDGSALDEEAFRRGTSVYFSERAIPMLPERLSTGICSLNPGVVRLTMSAVLELDQAGRVVDYRLAPSVIRSRERMTYTAVNELLSRPGGQTAQRYAHVVEMLVAMHGLALALIKRREKRGAIDFDLPEAELWFNDEGQIGGIVRSERNIAHRLIEEFMLLANETVAAHLEALGVPLIYRVHEEPNPIKVEEFAEIAASFGHRFSMHGPVPQRGFQRLTREIEGRPEARMLSFLMLRSMQRAKYTPQNTGHFGLAMKTYTHFTSPIRRYPDLIVHRILRTVLESDPGRAGVGLGVKRALKGLNDPVFSEEHEVELRRSLEIIAEQSSERERAADDAERELMDWRRAEFMAERTGDEFDGVISSVKDYGFYVELVEVFVEGLVHISTLRDDRYEFHERKHKLTGMRRGRVFRLGDPVRVVVDRVDRARHRINLSLAG